MKYTRSEALSEILRRSGQIALRRQKQTCGALSGASAMLCAALALLGTQVVAGTNCAVLCRVTPAAPDAVPSTQVATVYADLQGGASFTGFHPIDPAGFNQ